MQKHTYKMYYKYTAQIPTRLLEGGSESEHAKA